VFVSNLPFGQLYIFEKNEQLVCSNSTLICKISQNISSVNFGGLPPLFGLNLLDIYPNYQVFIIFYQVSMVGGKYCDIFVFVIVWVDEIDILVLSSNEVKSNKYYNDKQHRGNVDEGQLHIKPNQTK